ncbi:uncharacterized protein [Oryza sativa Japonica Group]
MRVQASAAAATAASASTGLRCHHHRSQPPPCPPRAPASFAGCRQLPDAATSTSRRRHPRTAYSGVESPDPPAERPDLAAAAPDPPPPCHVFNLRSAHRPAFHAQRQGAVEMGKRQHRARALAGGGGANGGKNAATQIGGEGSDVRVLQAAAAQMGKKGAAHVCITGGSSTDVKKTVAAQMGKKEATTHA